MTLPGGNQFNLSAWIRFAVQMLLLVVGIIGIYFRIDNRVSNLERVTDADQKLIAAMDIGGTHKSHETDLGQQTQIDEINRRVTTLESVIRDLVPKVERIDTNVLVLMARENKK